MATIDIQFDANALYCPSSNGAAMRLLEGATVKTFVRSFDSATEEFAHGKLRLPVDFDTGGTVSFIAAVLAETAASGKNVSHRFGHRAICDSESFDGSYANANSGDKAIDATQNDVSLHAWSVAAANLGWMPGDLVLFRYSRIAASANNLPGDMHLLLLTIKIPVS